MNSYISVNGVQICKFKPEDSETNAAPLCFGNVKDISVDNMKKSGLYEYVYNFSADYDSINGIAILDIHNCLMKKYDIK